jgi:hypothetical protein
MTVKASFWMLDQAAFPGEPITLTKGGLHDLILHEAAQVLLRRRSARRHHVRQYPRCAAVNILPPPRDMKADVVEIINSPPASSVNLSRAEASVPPPPGMRSSKNILGYRYFKNGFWGDLSEPNKGTASPEY